MDDTLKQKLCLGCLFCCNKIGISTRYEARKEIIEWLKIRGFKVKINSEGFLDIWHDSFPCPYLTAQGCSIYEKRPVACAVYDGRLTFGEKCKWTEVEDNKNRNDWYEFNKGGN